MGETVLQLLDCVSHCTKFTSLTLAHECQSASRHHDNQKCYPFPNALLWVGTTMAENHNKSELQGTGQFLILAGSGYQSCLIKQTFQWLPMCLTSPWNVMYSAYFTILDVTILHGPDSIANISAVHSKQSP